MAIEIFTGPSCGYCRQAKALLDRLGLDYVEYDIAAEAHREELFRRLPRGRAIPQIFVDGAHIGSYEDLAHQAEKGIFQAQRKD